MSALTSQMYSGDADLPQMVVLMNRCAALDPFEHATSVEELRADLNGPLQAPMDDSLLVHKGSELVGVCGLWRPLSPNRADAFLWMHVDPSENSAEIESILIEFGMKRIREIAAPGRKGLHLGAGVKDGETERAERLLARGFILDRHMLRMMRPLEDVVEPARLPDGFTLRTVAGIPEAARWAEMFNESFIDHWNHHPATAEMIAHDMEQDPNYSRDGDFVAAAPDGKLVAFCRCTIFKVQNQLSGKHEGWIHLLGTRRGYRNQGIGRAMLHEGMRWIQEQGMTSALLGVDAQSLTGATRLYESSGFAVVHRRTIYSLNESGG